MGIVLLLVYIEIPFQKLGQHTVKLIGMVHKSISGPEELPGLMIDEFHVFVFKLLHGL